MFAKQRFGAIVTASGLALAGAVFVVPPVSAHTTGIHDNCTELHKKWEHGVGRRDARDRTTSGDPVRNFHKSDRAYRRAVNHNGTLDADNDKIACEAH